MCREYMHVCAKEKASEREEEREGRVGTRKRKV